MGIPLLRAFAAHWIAIFNEHDRQIAEVREFNRRNGLPQETYQWRS